MFTLITLKTAEGAVNQLPPWTEVQGDIRLTPFYSIDECMKKIESYVAELNNGNMITTLYQYSYI